MQYFLKSNNVILLLAFHFFAITAHSQDILWEKSYGGKHADYLMDTKPTLDYGFVLAGSSLSAKSGNKSENNNGDLDYWIWKMDEKGDLDWQKNLGGSGSDFLQTINKTKDGGFIIGGNSDSNKSFDKTDNSNGQDDFWIIKLNAKGAVEWQKTIGGKWQEKLQSIIQTKDGGYIIGGSSSSDISGDKTTIAYGNLDYWLVKIDIKGKIEWQKTYGGTYVDELRSFEQTNDGGYILGGYSNSPISGNKTESNFGDGDFWILKLDSKGVITWQKSIGGKQDEQLAVVHQTYDGNYVLGGSSNSGASNSKSKANQSGTDFWVLKLDFEGAILWQEIYNFGKVDMLTSLLENEDHSLLLGGYAQSEKTGEGSLKTGKVNFNDKEGINDYIALKINENGEQLWSKTVGSAGEDILRNVIETRDGGYVLSGTSNSKKSRDKKGTIGSNDFWVVKLKDIAKPEKVKVVIEAFPNPANDQSTIIFGYDFLYGYATVVDMSGRELQRFDINSRTVPIDFSNLPVGIYIVNIKTNVQSDGIKVIKSNNSK